MFEDVSVEPKHIFFGILVLIAGAVLFLFLTGTSEFNVHLEKNPVKPGNTTQLTLSFKNLKTTYLEKAEVLFEVGDPRYIKIYPNRTVFERMFPNDVRTKRVMISVTPDAVPGTYNIKVTLLYDETKKVFYVPLEVKT